MNLPFCFSCFFLSASFCYGQVLEAFDPTCQSHFTSGYGYRLFFNLPPSSMLKDGSIHFNFSLSGASDGHVLFAVKPATYPAYEVVLGAGANQFSEIRKYVSNKMEVKRNTMTQKLLSSNEIRNFSISIQERTIAVLLYNKSVTKVLMSWDDPSPLDVKYVSFCAWTAVTVSWYYDCKGVKLAKGNESTLRKLKNKLLSDHDPYSIPLQDDNKLMIDASVSEIPQINLDSRKSVLTTVAGFNFSWEDYRLKWDPIMYDNITSINFFHHQVWNPYFILYNSVHPDSTLTGKYRMRVLHSGKVVWTLQTQLETWCTVDLSRWPFDSHLCNITFGLYNHLQSIKISLLKNNMQTLIQQENQEWKITGVSGKTDTLMRQWESNFTGDPLENHEVFIFEFNLERNAPIYIYAYYLPVIGSILMTCGCFILPVFSSKRLYIHAASLIIILINFLSLDRALPSLQNGSAPHIMSVSSNIFFLATIHVVATSCISALTKGKDSIPSKFVTRVVTNKMVSGILCIFGDYITMEDDNRLPEDSREMNHCVLFGVMLDRILFTLSLIYVAIICAL